MFRARPGIEKQLKSVGIDLPTTNNVTAVATTDGGGGSGSGSGSGEDDVAAAEEPPKPSDSVTVVFRVGSIVKKLFLCCQFGSVPLNEVE